MSEPVFFDAACRFGLAPNGTGATLQLLLEEMDRLGVAKALVRDFALGAQNAALSNLRLAEKLKEYPRLTGVWCLLPEQCNELPEPVKFFDEMKANRIGALTLQPYDHRWLPNRTTIGGYMEEAKARKVPVLLDAFFRQFRDLDAFLKEFPDNYFIFTGNTGKWGIDRIFRPMMDCCKNLYFSIDGYWVPRGIEELVKRYGEHRILFGSGFPQYHAGSAMLQLKHAELKEETICRIASGNLEALLKGEL